MDWKRSDISTFIRITTAMLEDQSKKRRDHELLHVFEKVEYSSIEELDSHGFALEKVFEKDEFLYFAVVMNDLKSSLEKVYLNKLISLEFNNLHDMETCFTKLHLLKANKNIKSFLEISCSCYYFLKHKKCKYVFKYLVDCKKEDIIEIKELKSNKTRGRPKKIAKNNSLKKD